MSAETPYKGKRTPGPSTTDSTTTEQNSNAKLEQLDEVRVDSSRAVLTTDQGVRIADNQNSLKAGARGPTLLEDFILREKITHFDHERIPERVVHARGEAAHGYFQVYESQGCLTKAKFLQNPDSKTPVFVRFSTVAGSRGSADTVRDARGFAVKFYTEEGNFDLVGNNIPVFFIQDAIKFPDLVHAVKPEPHHEMPQASSAHDTFWDFVVSTPETTHMVMWLMSDRALPRSHRMMEGFGVHTFRFINADGVSRFVKFHWKPMLGTHALAWDEAQKLAGKNPDFHRRDLWEAIESGHYPEWELGVQIVEEGDENKFDFDLIDPTKLIPEELVPVKPIGKLTLNRNPDNFFAETEQAAFHPGHIVPGIDFSDDPLLQGRLFSYLDTQLSRLGGPNFHQIPINRPISPVHNHHRDAMHQQQIHKGRVAYDRNTLANGYPIEAMPNTGAFVSYPAELNDKKVRQRSLSFSDHYSQATLFWKSLTSPEQDHIVEAFRFELAKVELPGIREKVVAQLRLVDEALAAQVATGLGLPPKPAEEKPPVEKIPKIKGSPALSMSNTVKNTIKSRKIAILAADGVNAASVQAMKQALQQAGAVAKIIAPHLGELTTEDDNVLPVDHTIATMPSIEFDAVFVPAGEGSISTLLSLGDSLHFVLEAYKHCKPMAAVGDGIKLLRQTGVLPTDGAMPLPDGVLIWEDLSTAEQLNERFIKAIAQHRYWSRNKKESVPA